MAAQTILELDLMAPVPDGNPAIAVTAPLTRPRPPTIHCRSHQAQGCKIPREWLRYAVVSLSGIMLRDSPYTKAFPEYTRAVVHTRDSTTA